MQFAANKLFQRQLKRRANVDEEETAKYNAGKRQIHKEGKEDAHDAEALEDLEEGCVMKYKQKLTGYRE